MLFHFLCFLTETSKAKLSKFCTFSEEEDGFGIGIKDVLVFATGADRVPALEFPLQPRISFIDPEQLSIEEVHAAGLF